ncbi:glycosyltransferase family 4 protein [Aeromonas veronii]|uniref:glycosyltransferase family 4 protein n=1 Tax=Aeromonas veronii TaxID=654 RepID=UPI000A91A409|nr:glycosyltransferase family 1 protein [Aeromonas veronii]
MSNIVINGRFLGQALTGVQCFALDYTRYLIKKNDKVIIVSPPGARDSAPNDIKPYVVEFGFCSGHIWEQFLLPIFLYLNGNPLLLCFCGLPPVLYKNKIFTIHDMSIYHCRDWFNPYYLLIYRVGYYFASKGSASILTVSDFSKSEIHRYLHVPLSKIVVLYNAISHPLSSVCQHASVSDAEEQRVASFFSSEAFNLVTVSSIEPRKNLLRLISVVNDLNSRGYKIRLIVVGKSHGTFRAVKFSEESIVGGSIVFTDYISDLQLDYVFRNMDGFVYASLYEGFGRPPLEAMFYNKPMAVSGNTCIPEVIGDCNGVLYLDPNKDADIYDKIKQMVCDGRNQCFDYSSILGKYHISITCKSLDKVLNP